MHLTLHEVVPELIDVEVITHLKLCGVLTLICSSFSNLLILLLSFDTALNGFLLISDASLQLKDALLAIALLFLDILHEVIEDSL